MIKHSEILVAEIRDSSLLKNDLIKLRINSFFIPILFSIPNLIVLVADALEWKLGIWLMMGSWIVATLEVALTELKPKYIYGFSVNEETITIYLVNIYGNKKDVVLQMNQVEKVKFMKKNNWRSFDKIWIHLDDAVKEFYFMRTGLGNKLIESLNVKKI